MSQKRKAVAVLAGALGAQAADLAAGSSKRVKFDDDAPRPASLEGEDTLGDLDIEEQDRKRLEPGRKGRVYAAGYESDSDDSDAVDDDDDDEGGRRREQDKGRDGGEAEEDDDDMFGVDGSDDDKKNKKGKGKAKAEGGKKRFLELGEIEGQEFGTGDRERGEDGEEFDLEMDLEDTDDEDGEVEGIDFNREMDDERTPPTSPGGTVLRDEEAEARRLKKRRDKRTMGVKLEGFNMKTDMATGRFDDEGNYIENAKDPHAEHDKWLAGNYSRSKIRAAREAQERREREAKEREARQMASEEATPLGCMKGLCEILEKGESVMEALQRLGKEARKEKDLAKRKAKEDAKAARLQRRSTKAVKDQQGADDVAMGQQGASSDAKANEKEGQPTPPSSKPESVVSQELERLTSLSSALMTRHGHTDVYEEEYETLLRVVRRSGDVEEDWDPARERSKRKEEEDGKDTHDGESSGAALPSNGNGLVGPATDRYEYKWSPSYLVSIASNDEDRLEKERQTFGPFAKAEMEAWGGGGYFGGEERERVLVRVVRGDGSRGEWDGWRSVGL